LLTPIWGAARPTPGAAWHVSTMSATSARMPSSEASTSELGASRRASP